MRSESERVKLLPVSNRLPELRDTDRWQEDPERSASFKTSLPSKGLVMAGICSHNRTTYLGGVQDDY